MKIVRLYPGEMSFERIAPLCRRGYQSAIDNRYIHLGPVPQPRLLSQRLGDAQAQAIYVRTGE